MKADQTEGVEENKAAEVSGSGDSVASSSSESSSPSTGGNVDDQNVETESEQVDTGEEDEVAISNNDWAEEESFAEEDFMELGDEVGPMVTDRPKTMESPMITGSFKGTRMSNVLDLETGVRGGQRGQDVEVRSENSQRPQRSQGRFMQHLLKPFQHILHHDDNHHVDGHHDDSISVSMHGRLKVQEKDSLREKRGSGARQYHLEAVHPHLRAHNRLAQWLGLGQGFEVEERSRGLCFGLSLNNIVLNYLRWSFRASFAAVFLSAALGFLGATMIFAFLIWRIGVRHPQCIGGVDFETDYFMDAFALSWTTFSTVGYGLVYAGISADKPDIKECTGITILVTFEAFVGVLFASFSGAIVFGKINRIQSFAQVTFSDPIVIRYGSGVQVEDAHDEDAHDSSHPSRALPCPVLEFRLANRLNGTVGGEILDASVNIVASIDASQATRQNTHLRRRRGRKGKRKPPRRLQGVLRKRATSVQIISEKLLNPNMEEGKSTEMEDEDPPSRSEFTIRRSTRPLHSNRTVPLLSIGPTQSFEEDLTGHLVSKRVFSKLEVESPDHPFFKRVWIIRHRLDQDSPLVRSEIRQQIKNAHGSWPGDLNSAKDVRSAIKFDQILVSMSGTSNADANSVYAQKVYDFVDINVGYRFVNMLYRDPVDESLRADIRLINDVVEQAGGGGEDFQAVDRQSVANNMHNMMVL
eukprot:scaffold2767_cov177-Amphora_coffeaeformis.AAC.26